MAHVGVNSMAHVGVNYVGANSMDTCWSQLYEYIFSLGVWGPYLIPKSKVFTHGLIGANSMGTCWNQLYGHMLESALMSRAFETNWRQIRKFPI